MHSPLFRDWEWGWKSQPSNPAWDFLGDQPILKLPEGYRVSSQLIGIQKDSNNLGILCQEVWGGTKNKYIFYDRLHAHARRDGLCAFVYGKGWKNWRKGVMWRMNECTAWKKTDFVKVICAFSTMT